MKPSASDLKVFHATVLSNGGEACLPKNLSDEWLQRISSDLEQALQSEEGEDDDGRSYLEVPMAAVIAILLAKHQGGVAFEVPMEKMFDHLVYYQMELALEGITRATEFSHSQASLEEMFEHDRMVEVHRVQAEIH